MAEVVIDLKIRDGKLTARLDNSAKSARKLEKDLGKSPKRLQAINRGGVALSSVFSRLGVVAAGAATALGAVFAVRNVVDAASKQADAVNAVANSLRLAGDASNAALKDVQDFASALQDTTGLGDETALQLFSVAQAYGANREQAKLAVTVANDYAAATGKSVNEALQQATKTLGGYAGELGEVNPQIKSLTSEQLKAGEALKILSDQFGGSAASKLQAFSGAVGALGGRFGDFLEGLGEIITQNPVVIAAINSLGGIFKSLGDSLKANGDAIRSFVNQGLIAVINIAPTVFRAIDRIVQILRNLAQAFLAIGESTGIFTALGFAAELLLGHIQRVADAYLRFYDILLQGIASVARVAAAYGLLSDSVSKSLESARSGIQGLRDLLNGNFDVNVSSNSESIFGDIAKQLEDLKVNVGDLGNSTTIDLDGSITGGGPAGEVVPESDTIKSLRALAEFFRSLKIDIPKRSNAQGAELDIIFPEIGETLDDAIARSLQQGPLDKLEAGFNQVFNDISTALETVTNGMLDGVADFIDGIADTKTAFDKFFKDNPLVQKAITGALGAGQNVLQGAAGATSLVSGAAGAAANYFLPGAGGAVAGIVTELAKGPEHVENMVNEFADALPVVLENIANGIDKFVEVFADRAGDIVIAIAKKAPAIAIAISKVMSSPQFQAEIAKSIALAARTALDEELVRLGKSLEIFQKEYEKAVRFIAKSIQEGIPKAVKGFEKAMATAFRDAIAELKRLMINVFKSGFVQGLFDFLGNLFATILGPLERLFNAVGGKGAGDFIGQSIKNITGGATGGLVAGNATQDTELFRLKSGEFVSDTSLTKDMKDMVSKFKSGGFGEEVASLLGQLVSAQSEDRQPVVIQVDGRVLAETIVDLNRRGQRLAV